MGNSQHLLLETLACEKSQRWFQHAFLARAGALAHRRTEVSELLHFSQDFFAGICKIIFLIRSTLIRVRIMLCHFHVMLGSSLQNFDVLVIV